MSALKFGVLGNAVMRVKVCGVWIQRSDVHAWFKLSRILHTWERGLSFPTAIYGVDAIDYGEFIDNQVTGSAAGWL